MILWVLFLNCILCVVFIQMNLILSFVICTVCKSFDKYAHVSASDLRDLGGWWWRDEGMCFDVLSQVGRTVGCCPEEPPVPRKGHNGFMYVIPSIQRALHSYMKTQRNLLFTRFANPLRW